MDAPATNQPQSRLILIRHGESEWNALHKWTGWVDVGLSDNGRIEAKNAARLLQDIPLSRAFTSMLSRAIETLDIMLQQLHLSIPVTKDHALDERNYGIYAGKNKLEIKAQIGEEEFFMLRRGWDYPIPEGESLKQVYTRVVPYYVSTILPFLKKGENIVIAAHGNSLRALMKHLEHVSDDDVANIELATGQIVVYTLDRQGNVLHKEIRGNASNKIQ